jgi:hypothetical protein
LYRSGPAPDWDSARDAANAAAATTPSPTASAAGVDLEMGYWALAGTRTALSPAAAVPAPGDAAALMVTLSRSASAGGVALPTFFARVFGIESFPVAASAVAAVTAPARIGPGAVFPLALSVCLYQQYWDANGASPQPKSDPGTGSPFVFRIGGTDTYSNCVPGGLTSFSIDSAASGGLATLTAAGNPSVLSVDQNIWLQTGVGESVFALIDACSERGNLTCGSVLVPVVALQANSRQALVTGFACLRILLANQSSIQGTENYVEVAMRGQCVAANASGAGRYYGVYATPRLAR